MMRRLRRGLTAIELIVTLIITSIVLSMAFWGIMAIQTLWNNMMDQNAIVAQNRMALDSLADHLRNAQPCSDSTKGTLNSVVAAGGTGTVTYYSDTGCSTVRYYAGSNSLYRQVGTTSTLVSPNISTFTCKYYTNSTYYGTSGTSGTAFVLTTTPSVPTTTELPALSGALVSISSALNGQTMTTSTWVRFRNSPKKTTVAGT